MKRSLTIAVAMLLLAVAFLVLATGASGETLWSVGQAIRGLHGAASPDAEASRVAEAIGSNDAAAFAALSPRPLSDLYGLVGRPVVGLQSTQADGVTDPNAHTAYFRISANGLASDVVFYLRRGPLTGWRVDGFEVTP